MDELISNELSKPLQFGMHALEKSKISLKKCIFFQCKADLDQDRHFLPYRFYLWKHLCTINPYKPDILSMGHRQTE